jgi:hypothetical protein
MRGMSLMPSKWSRPNTGVDWARVSPWMVVGRVLEKSFEDVDGLPDAARDEVAEQGYIGVRHVVVGNSTVRPITYRILSQEAVLGQVVFRAIGRSRTAAAPGLGEIAAVVRIDEVFDNRIELIDTYVAPIRERDSS